MCIAHISVFENINQKVHDPISKYSCDKCKSKKLQIVSDEHGDDGMVSKFKQNVRDVKAFWKWYCK